MAAGGRWVVRNAPRAWNAVKNVPGAIRIASSRQYWGIMARIKMFAENFAIRKNVAVLGKYPSYIETAKKYGYKYFDLGTKIWNKLDRLRVDPWKYNIKFLDKIAKKGGEFIISTPNKIDGYLMTEIEYLTNQYGYRKVVVDGVTKLVKGK